MTTRQKILLALLGLGVAIAAVFLATSPSSNTSHRSTPKPTSTATANIDPSTPAGTPSTTPSAPEATQPPLGGTDDSGSTDGSTGTVNELGEYRQAADAAVLAYVTVVDGESVEARAARLTPYFPAGSPLLTVAPDIANPQHYADVTATVTPISKALANIESETDAEYGLLVVLKYQATYVSGGVPMNVTSSGTWHVTMSKAFDGKLLTLIEPTFS